MEFNDFLVLVGGLSISVIGYFLRNALTELKEVKEISYSNKNKIDLLEREYMLKIERLNEKIAMLYEAIDKLNDNIDKLTERIR
jgi:phage host-nuclease inhibitor protein Gam